MIKPAPKRVSTFGISPQMKYPNNIANTKFKYFIIKKILTLQIVHKMKLLRSLQIVFQ